MTTPQVGDNEINARLEELRQHSLTGAPRILAPETIRRLPSYRYIQATLFVFDFATGLAGGLIASWARWQGNSPELFGLSGNWISLIIAVVWVCIMQMRGADERNVFGIGLEEYRRILSSGSHLCAAVAVVVYGLGADLSRAYAFGSVALIVLLTLASHFVFRRFVHLQRRRGRAVRRVILAGTEESVIDLAEHFGRLPEAGYAVTGVVLPDASARMITVGDRRIPVLGQPHEIDRVMERNQAQVLAVADTAVFADGELRRLAWDLGDHDIDLVVAPAIADLAGPRISVTPVAGLPLLHVDEPRFNHGSRLAKVCVERVLAAVLLVVLAPVLGLIAVLVRLTSSGPAIFKQERVGLDGSTFKMWKFRSMVADAESLLPTLLEHNESDGLLFKMERDPRITPVGRWLRRFSLDELPQLVNVLVGQMSLVGPRPSLPREVEQYDEVIRRRLLVRPGITGLWQVSGRADLTWQESVRLDVYYVDNWSLALDAAILLKTVTAVFGSKGAY